MAGVAGFEPTNARIKILCLTTWRHPYNECVRRDMAGVVGLEPTQCWNQNPMPYHLATPHHDQKYISGVIEGDRTLDLQSHNLAFCQLNYDHHNFWCSQKDSNLRPLP